MPVVPGSGNTVGDVADRTIREFLYPADDQPITLTLDGALDTSTTTVGYDASTLSPDEEELLAPGVIIEVGTEQMRLTAADFNNDSLTVIRAVNGTGATAHSDNDEIRVAPVFTRSNVIEAVCDNVVALYPDLWYETSTEVTSAITPVEVPETFETGVAAIWQPASTRWFHARVPELLDPFPPSSTGKAVQFYDIPADRTVHITYRSSFERPTSEADSLEDLGVRTEWQRIVCVGAAAQVVSGRPADELTVEFLTEMLERETHPPGTATSVRNGLLTLRQIWIEQARRSLNAEKRTPVTYNPLMLR